MPMLIIPSVLSHSVPSEWPMGHALYVGFGNQKNRVGERARERSTRQGLREGQGQIIAFD